MYKPAALAFIASLFALTASGTGAEAKQFKFRFNNGFDNDRISCNTARHMVRERGYNPVKVKSCISNVYSFYAVRKGRVFIFYVDSRTGFITRG